MRQTYTVADDTEMPRHLVERILTDKPVTEPRSSRLVPDPSSDGRVKRLRQVDDRLGATGL